MKEEDIQDELIKSMLNVNYSQWERTKSSEIRRAPKEAKITTGQHTNVCFKLKIIKISFLIDLKVSIVKRAPTKPINIVENKCSNFCNHSGASSNVAQENMFFKKSRKQLLIEEEKARIKQLKIKRNFNK